MAVSLPFSLLNVRELQFAALTLTLNLEVYVGDRRNCLCLHCSVWNGIAEMELHCRK